MPIRLSLNQNLHIQTSSDIFHLLQPTYLRQSKLNRDREHLWLMCLDHSQTVRTLELLGLGTQNNVRIDPMEVYHRALLRRAASIVVAHNHPSGSLKPSRSDITATEKLVDVSHFLNIKLLPGSSPGQAITANSTASWIMVSLKRCRPGNSSCSTVSWQWSDAVAW
ncbi:MAG: JAB domain-containing protein [Chitinophagaceae bacterium]